MDKNLIEQKDDVLNLMYGSEPTTSQKDDVRASMYSDSGDRQSALTLAPEINAAADRLENMIFGDRATRTVSNVQDLGKEFTNRLSTGVETGIKGGVDYATSLPTLGKVALGATLAGAGAAAGAGLVNRAFRKRTEKKKKKKTLNEYNPYSQRLTPAATGGAAGATVGTLSGLLGGKAAAKALTSALKITNPALATTIDIIGQGFGTAIGGGVGGYGGYELGRALTPKKKKKRNPLLPSVYDRA